MIQFSLGFLMSALRYYEIVLFEIIMRKIYTVHLIVFLNIKFNGRFFGESWYPYWHPRDIMCLWLRRYCLIRWTRSRLPLVKRPWMSLIRKPRGYVAQKGGFESARCCFKMVISRPREHFARGQFNSGRMITPSPSSPLPSPSFCPFIFLHLPLSTQSSNVSRFPFIRTLCVYTYYIISIYVYNWSTTLRLPSVFFLFKETLAPLSDFIFQYLLPSFSPSLMTFF